MIHLLGRYRRALFVLITSTTLCSMLLSPFAPFQTGEAIAATLQQGDVTRAQSGGIVLDADLHTKQPLFDRTISTSTASSDAGDDRIHTYSYSLRVTAKTYQTLGTPVTARWEDVGFDADDDRIDLAITWLADSRWYSTKTLSSIPLLQRYERNSFDTAGICIGSDSKNTGGKTCCEQHIKIAFFKHGTSTPASGSFLTKITDLDKAGWDGGYGDRWCESVEFISGHASEIFIPSTNILKIGKNRNSENATDYRATKEMEGSSLDSGLVTRLSSNTELWYYSTHGWTDILDQFDVKHISVSAGKGGAVHCNGKSGAVAVGWRGDRTILVESDTGYKIDTVYVDGSSIGAVCSYSFNDMTEDHSISASFAPITYTIDFEPNGAQGRMDVMTLSYGETRSLLKNAYERKGYRFVGWNTKADGSGEAYHDLQEILNLCQSDGATFTLHAQWKSIGYEVSFDANGGTETMGKQAFIYDHSQPLALNRFARCGYLFAGWNTCADGTGNTYTNLQEVKNLASTDGALVTLFAQWKPISYHVIFDAQGGSGAMHDQLLTYDQAESLNKNLLWREGFRWIGWNSRPSVPGVRYNDQALVENLSACANDLVMLYAVWAANRYLVVFDANGGVGTMDTQAFAYGISEKLHPNAFVRPGYSWRGWNTQPDGAGVAYDDEQSVRDLSVKDNSVVTLFAQWTRESPEVQPDHGTEGPDQPPAKEDTDQPAGGEDTGQVAPVPDDLEQDDAAQYDPGANDSEQDDSARHDPNANEPEQNDADTEGEDATAIKPEQEAAKHDRADYDKTGASISPLIQFASAGLALGLSALLLGMRQHRSQQERTRQPRQPHSRS